MEDNKVLTFNEKETIYSNFEIDTIYDTAPVGLCVFDKDLHYVRLNQFFAEQDGKPVAEHLGRTPLEIVPDLWEQAKAIRDKVLLTGKTVSINVEGETPAQPGVKRYWDESWSPIKDNHGNIIGISAVAIEVTEQKKMEVKNLDLIEMLRKENEDKNHFLHVMSHELRNPLASIILSLSLEERLPVGGVKAKKAREVAMRQLNHLSRLVDDLLDITRINTRKLNIKKNRLVLNEILENVATDYENLFVSNNLVLEVDLTSFPLYIEADSDRITQAIGNLLNNSIKFNSKEGKTVISLQKDIDKNEAVIIVEDNGIGIKKDLIENLFNPFTQIEHSEKVNRGLGLGLSIVKGIVEFHKGSIEGFSEGLGKGTKFTVRLPLAHENQETNDNVTNVENCPQKLIVLIIDDNKDLAEVMCELINILDHVSDYSNDGQSGISKARSSKPNVIICDIGLPDMSGYDVAKIIRKDNSLRNVFLIALSGYSNEENIKNSIEAGFNKHLSKPITFDKLKSVLDEIEIF